MDYPLFLTVASAALWALAAYWAWKKQPYYIVVLVIATVYCLASEYLSLRLGKYHYGAFPLSIPDLGLPQSFDHRLTQLKAALPFVSVDCVANGHSRFPRHLPLGVVLFEAALLFSVVRLTNLLAPPTPVEPFSLRRILYWVTPVVLVKPLLDGLVGINLDGILDPVVSGTTWCGIGSAPPAAEYGGLALWTWHTDNLHMGYWFGVPLANYTSWFVAVVAFTIAVRVGEHQLSVGPLNFKRHCGCAVATFLGSLLFLLLLEFTLKLSIDYVMFTQPVLKSLPQAVWQFGFLGSLLGASLLLVLWKTKFFAHLKSDARFEFPAVAPHFFVFLFCLMGLAAGIYERSLVLIVVWLVATAIGLLYVRSPFRRWWAAWKERSVSSRGPAQMV